MSKARAAANSRASACLILHQFFINITLLKHYYTIYYTTITYYYILYCSNVNLEPSWMSLKLQNAVVVSVSFCERNWSDLLHYYYVLLHCLLFKCNSRTYYDYYILYYSNVNLEPSWNVLTTTKCCYSLCFFFVKEIEVT